MREARESNLLSVSDVARRLNVSRPTVYRLVHAGQIPAVRIGQGIGPIRIDERELYAWLYSEPNVAMPA